MDPLGNVNGHDGDQGKVVRGRRSWSKVEEDALIHCLVDTVNNGWNVENEFKAGFQRELEKGMKKILTGINIVDPYLKSVRFKYWSYYNQWLEIFGKDRSTGENAVDPVNLMNDLLGAGFEQEGKTGDKYYPCSPHAPNELVDSLGEFMKHSKEVMFDNKDVKEVGLHKTNKNKQLNEIMKRITGLKISDKLKVCDELVQNKSHLKFFLSRPFEEQVEYIWMLLDGRL
ncbi:hypothetical protein ACS0TY_033288 [Phlomoides rotata]